MEIQKNYIIELFYIKEFSLTYLCIRFVVDVMSQEEIESDYDQNVIEEISGIIYHKAKILLKAITKKNKDKWFKQLMITTPNQSQTSYIDQIIDRFDHILNIYRSQAYVDREKTQELCKFILSVIQYF